MESKSGTDERTVAQFFFEIGYGACFAEALIANDMKGPFDFSDARVEHAWDIAGEAHDEPEEFDRQQALADAAPDLLEALEAAEQLYQDGLLKTPSEQIKRVHALRRAAIARARGSL